jgi:hypothetical protein
MAHAHYPEDPDRAHLDALAVFEVGQTANYACEDELYGPYREGIGEAAARVAVALDGERMALELLHCCWQATLISRWPMTSSPR